jgi:hypothetical protein
MTEQTEHQKNIELLGYCGWTKIRIDTNYGMEIGCSPQGIDNYVIPDPYNDLNAQRDIIYPELIKHEIPYGFGLSWQTGSKTYIARIGLEYFEFGDNPAPTFAEAALRYFRSIK